MPFLVIDEERVIQSEQVDDVVLEGVLENLKKAINSKTLISQAADINIYHSYNTRSSTSPREVKKAVPSYMLSAFLMSSYKLTLTESNDLVKLLNSFSNRNFDRSVFYKDKHIDLSELPENVQALFTNTTIRDKNGVKVKACIVVDYLLIEELRYFLNGVNNISPNDYSEDKLPVSKPVISIAIGEFLAMSTLSKLSILSKTVNVKRGKLQVALDIKKDYGNLGREYHTIANIPRTDRSRISNLNGYDFESALQVIVLALLKEVYPDIELSVTTHFVKNKKDVRQYVVDNLHVDMDMAKKVITAAYQGGGLKGIPYLIGTKTLTKDQKDAMEGLYGETKLILEQLLQISSVSFKAPTSTLGKHFKAARWYASKRTILKHELPVDDFTLELYNKYMKKKKAHKIRKSYMFYLWTYFEGEARKIVETHLDKPITLHDAVYTQDQDSFDSFDVADVEAEIYEKIGIPLKLSEA